MNFGLWRDAISVSMERSFLLGANPPDIEELMNKANDKIENILDAVTQALKMKDIYLSEEDKEAIKETVLTFMKAYFLRVEGTKYLEVALKYAKERGIHLDNDVTGSAEKVINLYGSKGDLESSLMEAIKEGLIEYAKGELRKHSSELMKFLKDLVIERLESLSPQLAMGFESIVNGAFWGYMVADITMNPCKNFRIVYSYIAGVRARVPRDAAVGRYLGLIVLKWPSLPSGIDRILDLQVVPDNYLMARIFSPERSLPSPGSYEVRAKVSTFTHGTITPVTDAIVRAYVDGNKVSMRHSGNGIYTAIVSFPYKGYYKLRVSAEKDCDTFLSIPIQCYTPGYDERDLTTVGSGIKIELDEGGQKLYLHVYDESGHHVGINYSNWKIETEVPGSRYFDDLHGAIAIVPGDMKIGKVEVDASNAVRPVEDYNLAVKVLKNGKIIGSVKKTEQIKRGTSKSYEVMIKGTEVELSPYKREGQMITARPIMQLT